MKKKVKKEKKRVQIVKLFFTLVLMTIGLYFFKWFPMAIYGENILFDSSAHIVFASFILYILYFFIDQNKSWRIPFFIFACAVLMIISFQRIYENAHNDIGLLLGLIIALVSIALGNWNTLGKKIEF